MATEPQAKKTRVELKEGVVLALGNPLLDISATVDKDFLDKFGLEANNAILAEEKHLPMYQEMTEKFNAEFIPGGAAQNSIRVTQWLLGKDGKNTSYIGCIGNDDYGKILSGKATGAGVTVNYLVHAKEPTGTCAVCITGKHRSLVANLAAANHYSKTEHLDKPENWAFVEKAEIIYITGFFLTVSPESIVAVGKHAAEKNKIFTMNLSAPFLCQVFKKPMMDALPYVDILFGNETEAGIFAKEQELGTEDLKEIAIKIAALEKVNKDRPRIVVITHGKEPTLVVRDGKVTEYPVIVIKEEDIVDTNGAGDAFVGGFLSQLAQGKPIDECVRCGHYAANHVIQQSGVTLTDLPSFS